MMFVRTLLLAITTLLAVACSQPSESQPSKARPAPAPAARGSNGFPLPDRPVAEIVSSTWSSGPDRDKVNESGQIIKALGIAPGMAVADIGAGSGYHTLRLSTVVGPQGRVYAQDIMADYLAGLGRAAESRGLTNVETVLGEPDDPKLPPKSVDRAILVHMYHEIENPYALLWNLVPALKPGAKVGIVDLDRLPENHGTPPALLKCEVEAVGYRQTGFVELQGRIGYLAVFEPPAPDQRPAPDQIRPCRQPR